MNVDEYGVPFTVAVTVTLVVGIEAPWRALIIIPEGDGIHITPASVGYDDHVGTEPLKLRVSVVSINVYMMTSPGFSKILGLILRENI